MTSQPVSRAAPPRPKHRTDAVRAARVMPPARAAMAKGPGTPTLPIPGAAFEPITRDGRPLRVLVVEDEALIAMQIEMTLEDAGIEVVGTADTAAAALRLAEERRPDLVTMDIRIKGERDGTGAAKDIYDALGIRCIFVSAYANAETRERGDAARPHAWVMKPFNARELLNVVAAAAADTD